MHWMMETLLALTVAPAQMTAAPPAQVDVELLLAVDVSASMDIEEARTQRLGYVEALKHPDFINAVKSGMLGRIAIGYYEWSGAANLQSVVQWQLIDDAEDAQRFAEKVDKPVTGSRRGTSLSKRSYSVPNQSTRMHFPEPVAFWTYRATARTIPGPPSHPPVPPHWNEASS